jgi:hypothetical protein
MKCKTCGNPKETRRVRSLVTGPMGRPTTVAEVFCPYCEWKGISGPGKQLRDLIKQQRPSS